MYNLYIYIHIYMVGDIPTPLKIEFVSWEYDSQYILYIYIYHLLPFIATQPPIRDPPFRAPRHRHSAMPYEPTGPARGATRKFPQGGP